MSVCLDVDFRNRMFLLPIYLLGSRYLLRMPEICYLTNSCWDPRLRILAPDDLKTDNPRTILADIEVSWVLDCLSVGRAGSAPLILSTSNDFSDPHYMHQVMKSSIVKAGLPGLTPYGVKYGTASKMFKHPEQFTNFDVKAKIDLVRKIAGHTDHSASTEVYIDLSLGSEHQVGVRDYYDAHRIFPFRVEDYPTPISPGYKTRPSEE